MQSKILTGDEVKHILYAITDECYSVDEKAQIVNTVRAQAAARSRLNNHPKIVCLCGSTRFWKTFQKASLQETLAGNIVLSIGAASGTDDEHFGNLPRDEYDSIKTMLDELHLRKIDLADEVLILNVDGYIGKSTKRELEYALKLGRPVRYWEGEQSA